MNTRSILSVIALPLITASAIFASVSCKAQTNIDLTGLFSSSNQFDVNVWSGNQNYASDLSQSVLPTQSLVDSAPIRFQPALYEWQRQDALAAIEYVAFSHFETAKFTEATYEPELKIGYSQPLQGFVDTLFNISVASIKPCANSFLTNALSAVDKDNIGDRSAFLSVSIHSKF